MAVGQNQRDPIFGIGAPPILVYFSGIGMFTGGYNLLTHGHISEVEVGGWVLVGG